MYRVENVPGGRGMTTEIAGRDRFKFFRRPMAPTIEGGTQTALPLAYRPTIQRAVPQRSVAFGSDNVGASVHPVKSQKLAPLQSQVARQADEVAAPSATTCDVGCQTMYRENECQTDPYTPDYIVEEGQQPEVLAIMELRFGEGLPAGLGEVEMIDRVQRRRLVEANLPQGTDDESTKLRLEALEELEKVEWEERETHIKNLQETRLQQMERALARREAGREEESRKRVAAMQQTKLAEVDKRLSLLQQRRFSTTRKLTTMHANPCCERQTRDIINAHVLYGPRSKAVESSALVDAGTRGTGPADNYDVRPTLLTFTEGVHEVERVQAPRIESIKMTRLAPPENEAVRVLPTNFQKRRAGEVLKHLDHANAIIEDSHTAKAQAASIQDLYRATPRLQRPDTPVLHLQGDDEEDREEAILLLQRLLRGRAVQNDFYEGKERCHGLIEELQSASNAKDANRVWEPEQRRAAFRATQDAIAQSVVDGVQGDIVFGTVDFLYKELQRQQEMWKVGQLRAQAESERKAREDAERARRAEECAKAERAEAQYVAVIRAVDNTVDSFIGNLFSSTVSNAARSQALREEWMSSAARPPPSDPTTDSEKEKIVVDLLDSFVVPQAIANATQERHQHLESLSTSALEIGAALIKSVK